MQGTIGDGRPTAGKPAGKPADEGQEGLASPHPSEAAANRGGG